MIIVYTGEEMPETITKSLFLAGPTPRNQEEQESWRPQALDLLEKMNYDGVVFVPEGRGGKFKMDYDDQIEWEHKHLNVADCIVFWVPRDLTPDSKGFPKMAAFTTNVEWGTWQNSGKVVFGCPPDLEKRKNKYLKHYADYYKVSGGESLEETLGAAVKFLEKGAERSGGERYVPLFIWQTPSFQSWYRSQQRAGNSINSAELLYTFRPGYKEFVFLWILKVDLHIESENRDKTNEFVLARTDISSVCLYRDKGDILDTEVVIIKEFRSPANTEDGFIRELAGGSSLKPGEEPEEVAAEEVFEETGFYLSPDRLRAHEARQLAGTLSSHKAYLFSVKLDKEEMAWFKSQVGVVHGNMEDSERTFIEVYTVEELLNNQLVDWSTLGMLFAVLHN